MRGQVVVRNKMNKKYISVLVVFLVVVLGAYLMKKPGNSLPNQSDTTVVNGVKSVNATEFAKLANNDNAFVIDVHIPEQAHMPGTDAFIPYNEILDNLDKLPQDKNTPILVYCRSGSMSKEAAQTLLKAGYTNIIELEGGLDEYKRENVSVDITPVAKALGTVIYGEVAKTEFTLTNFTPKELTITRVSTSCGCTTAKVDKKSLAPYESTVVNVSFNPAFHKDDTDLGDITRTIYVDTDNSSFKQVTATITATVIKK